MGVLFCFLLCVVSCRVVSCVSAPGVFGRLRCVEEAGSIAS